MTKPDPSKVSREAIAEDYDRRYQNVGDLRESDTFYRWVLQQLSPQPGKHLLDVACGEGHMVKWALQQGLKGAGIDISINAARLSREVVPVSFAAVADGERLPFLDESFDYVTNMGSLEHFLDPQRGVREMRRVLRPDGRVAVFLPNSYYLVDIIWHVWRTGYSVSHKQVVERFATVREWRDVLEASGLRVDRTCAYNFRFPRARSDWTWYRRHPRKWLNLLVAPFIPFNLSYSFLFIGSKRRA